MAPKKNATKNDIVPKGRPPKSKEKPILKIPTVVKIKFPLKNLSRIVQNVKSPNPDLLNKRAKDLTPNDKLELTNRVARAQLSKSDCIVFMPQPETGNEIRSVVKKRGKKKKVEEKASTSTEACTNHEPESLEPICINKEGNLQTPKRKRVRKTLIKPVNKVPANEENNMTEEIDTNPTAKVSRAPLKRKLVNPKDGNKNPPKKKWMQTKIPEMKILVRRNSKVNSDMSRTVTIEKPKIVRRQGRPERGKKNVEKIVEPVQELQSTITQSVHDLNHTIKKEDDDDITKNANAIDSRKTSINSELSWTKDISDSSNTTSLTAVTSSDFVLIDRKLPEINLTKINLNDYINGSKDCKPQIPEVTPKAPEVTPQTSEFTPRTPSDSSSSSSDSDSSDSESNKDTDIGSTHSLNLSMSSESHRSPIITQKNINMNSMHSTVTKISKALDKLSMSLKKIDLEMINWVGYQNEDININGKKVRDKICQNLKEESNIIVQCRHINKLLTDKEEINSETNVTENLESKNNETFVKPTDVVPKTLNKSSDQSTSLDKGNHSRDHVDFNDGKCELNDNLTSNNVLYSPFDQFDDEDALSLYAESIGFESHRNSTSSPPGFNPEIEEYIPQPVAKIVPNNTIIYNPTKIPNAQISTGTVQNVKPVTTVCEKQNADSTSVVRDGRYINDRIEGIEKLPEPTIVRKLYTQAKTGPCLLATIFKPAPGIKSVVFKGMCFFHLIGSCKNQSRCRFPHVEPAPLDITAKLVRLSEDFFIHEYMLLKCWPGLRRKFGMCFVDECKRRDLTRLLVEMAIDFVMKANINSHEDAALKVHVLEEVLLYLNNIDLATCEDLLKYVIQGKELCVLFMETIANTQNFSRFKPVFIKLVEFMIKNERLFNAQVASHILERVAILPFNDSLAWALISIIKHTEAVIFKNSMMGQFEKQLSSNEGLQREFLSVKEMAGCNQLVVNQVYNSVGPVRQEMDRPMTSPLYPDGVQRYTSPDTTHLDGMNKPPDEQAITRSVNFDRTFQNFSSSSSDGTEEYPRAPKPNSLFNSWRHKTIFNKFSPQEFSHKRRMDRQVTNSQGDRGQISFSI
ncbi:uncharacterized protein LOC128679169 isoform X2 [Plodia interpunctella]|uniref:uncharacterized protein LOC128679169 isoform X2 n=1 Tax=Plodia interpunctella TaxID=58824 RepID=UPI0023678EFE|nr:uncharacterized protein LOC128679169 isoform X2 [Plodia interpunctella]